MWREHGAKWVQLPKQMTAQQIDYPDTPSIRGAAKQTSVARRESMAEELLAKLACNQQANKT
jgi:hypothetical protein